MNMGHKALFNPQLNDLIHELGHVWQSQHHYDPFQFMYNSVASQGAALALNLQEAATDGLTNYALTNRVESGLTKDIGFPGFYPFDSYAYDRTTIPVFARMGAEQMAKALEIGDPTIIGHARSIPMNAVDPDCIAALAKPAAGDRRIPGVR